MGYERHEGKLALLNVLWTPWHAGSHSSNTHWATVDIHQWRPHRRVRDSVVAVMVKTSAFGPQASMADAELGCRPRIII